MRRPALLALLLLAACADPIPLAGPPVPVELALTSPRTTVPIPQPAHGVADDVTAAARRASRPDIGVGVLVVGLRWGANLVSVNADRPFRSASLSTLLMAPGALRGGTADRAGIWAMPSRADDRIADALWVRTGGSAMVAAMAERLDLTGTCPPALPTAG